MNKILFIGSLQWGQKSTGGGVQTKNQHFLRYVMAKYKDYCFYDTYNKNPFVVLINALYYIIGANRNTIIFISIAYRGIYVIAKMIDFLHLKRRLFYLAPGGDLTDYLKERRVKRRIMCVFEKIFVQAQYMKSEMVNMGYDNVEVLQNFKPILYTPPTSKEQNGNFRFVYLSRIKKDKGIDEIVDAVRMLNRQDISVDFYGTILEPYSEQYFRDLSQYNIHYKGFLDLNNKQGYELLSRYDLFLFPTYFEGEGFPGALIDSFIAGVPVIATDFHANSEIIRDNVNGILIPTKDVNALAGAMKRLIESPETLFRLRSGAIKTASNYDINKVLGIILSEIEL